MSGGGPRGLPWFARFRGKHGLPAERDRGPGCGVRRKRSLGERYAHRYAPFAWSQAAERAAMACGRRIGRPATIPGGILSWRSPGGIQSRRVRPDVRPSLRRVAHLVPWPSVGHIHQRKVPARGTQEIRTWAALAMPAKPPPAEPAAGKRPRGRPGRKGGVPRSVAVGRWPGLFPCAGNSGCPVGQVSWAGRFAQVLGWDRVRAAGGSGRRPTRLLGPIRSQGVPA
jgi:hypothetical protein